MRTRRPSAEELQLLDPDGAFRGRLEADRQALARAAASGARAELARLVHGLAGAAGTFGYPEIGDIALALDDRIVAGETLAPSDVARLLAALESLTDP